MKEKIRHQNSDNVRESENEVQAQLTRVDLLNREGFKLRLQKEKALKLRVKLFQ